MVYLFKMTPNPKEQDINMRPLMALTNRRELFISTPRTKLPATILAAPFLENKRLKGTASNCLKLNLGKTQTF